MLGCSEIWMLQVTAARVNALQAFILQPNCIFQSRNYTRIELYSLHQLDLHERFEKTKRIDVKLVSQKHLVGTSLGQFGIYNALSPASILCS